MEMEGGRGCTVSEGKRKDCTSIPHPSHKTMHTAFMAIECKLTSGSFCGGNNTRNEWELA